MKTRIFLLAILAMSSCGHFFQLPELTEVCLRYVDSEGFLRGRTAMFTTHKVPSFSGKLEHSYEGACLGQEEGPAERIMVCLAASSACHNDRTRDFWEDEVDAWFDRYPDSYRGECTDEGQDTCLDADQFRTNGKTIGCAPWDKKCVDGKLQR